MNRRTWIHIQPAVSLLFAFLLLLNSSLTSGTPTASGDSVMPAFKKKEYAYTMNVGARPMLFWISWKNVGGGRISWIEKTDGGKGLELLIGSDPARAPRKINRWGYIAEQVSGSSSELVGIMTQSDEQSVEQAQSNIGQSSRIYAFKAIRCQSSGSEAQSFTIPLQWPEDFTYRDVSMLLSRIPAADSSMRHLKIPAGVDPGFLFAVKGMIEENVEKYRSSGELLNSVKPRRYIYNASLFALSMASSKFLNRMTLSGHEYQKLLESKFEARNDATGKTSSFSITYGTESPISKIPIRILYQPRWWFRAELVLDESVDMIDAGRKAGAQ